MKKSIIGLLCTCLMLAALLPVCSVAAYGLEKEAQDEDTLWPGISFQSLAEFEAYLNECHRKNSFDEIGEYYSKMKSVYIPKAFRRHSYGIYMIAAEYYSYYDVCYQFGSTTYWFGTYYETKSGESMYKLAKEYFDKKDDYTKYRPQKHEVNGYTVYAYYVLGETWYCWQQDGVYHYLRVNKKPHDMCLEYCDAALLPLNLGGGS